MQELDFDLTSIQEARDLARKGQIAANQLKNYSVEQIDRILKNMVEAAEMNAKKLAEMAVEETGFGNAKDKLYKNHMASGLLYEQIKDKKTIGIIDADEEGQVITIADPVGLLMGIIPSTNPTSTVFFKALIAVKSRNPIIFSPHPSALNCSMAAIKLMNKAVVEAGGPENVIQGISKPSIEATNALMHADEVKLIIATGGPGMVKAAYSSGKPAIGVGAGNSPAYIERTANVENAVRNIMASKTFDNGTICASEQSVIVEHSNKDAVVKEFKKQGGYFMNEEETKAVCKLLFRGNNAMNPKFVGRKASVIAEAAGISIPDSTRVLIGEQKGVGPSYPLSYEKLTCVLGFYTVNDWHEACELSIELLQNGIGHTMSLHTEDKNVIREYAVKPASRILINTGSTMGGTGLSTSLGISLTLGCGTMGGSSVSENVGPEHLINIKKMAYGIKDCETLAMDDHIFRKYHGTPEVRHEVKAEERKAVEKKELPIYGREVAPYEGSGVSYKVGCGSCSSSSSTLASDEAIDLEALKKMVNDMVEALKG